MTRLLRAAVALFLLSLSVGVPMVFGQALPSKEQILANLKLRLPLLRTSEVKIGSVVPSTFAGFHQGTIHIDGREIGFLLADDTAQLLLLADTTPIDVGLSLQAVEVLLEEEQRQLEIAEEERHRLLLQFADGMVSRGPADAPVTVFEFSDFQCPYCRNAFMEVEELLQFYPDQVRFVYLHFPLPNHDWARQASIASVCAANQSDEAFWALYESYFMNQPKLTLESLIDESRGYLERIGIDMDIWTTCATDQDSEAYRDADALVEESIETASVALRVNGTPSFFVNGKYFTGAQTFEFFEELVQGILSSGPPE